MARRNLSGSRVLITGASSGIGRAIAIKLSERGARVLATARREERLQELVRDCQSHPGTVNFLAGDVSQASHRSELVLWIESQWNGLDILINNAGVGAIGRFDEASEGRLRQIMEIDFFSPVELTRLCLPFLKKGIRPGILNIGSVLAHRAVPNKSEYCAAKFAMRGWTESLRVELSHDHIDVLLLSPSTTKSEFFDSLVQTDATAKNRSLGSMTTDQVASAAISALVRSKREMILSWSGKSLVWAGRFFPRFTDRLLSRFGTD